MWRKSSGMNVERLPSFLWRCRLQWFGLVLCRPETELTKTILLPTLCFDWKRRPVVQLKTWARADMDRLGRVSEYVAGTTTGFRGVLIATHENPTYHLSGASHKKVGITSDLNSKYEILDRTDCISCFRATSRDPSVSQSELQMVTITHNQMHFYIVANSSLIWCYPFSSPF